MGCCMANAKAEYKSAKDEFTKARFGDYIISIQAMIDVVECTEAADVQPVYRGHWDYSEEDNGECEWYFCSVCDSPAEQLYTDEPLLSEFCPHCGADMRGVENAKIY